MIKLYESPLAPQEFAVRNLAEQISSATNIALAIEIRLKALWYMCGSDPPEHHDLWALFKSLPNSGVRRKLELLYDKNITKMSLIKEIGSLEVAISTSDLTDDKLPAARGPRNLPSLKDVLKVSKDAFQTWRYIYESAPIDGGVIIFHYEYARLFIFSVVLGRYISVNSVSHSHEPDQ